MLKDNLLYNETVKANSREIELLKKNFPNYFNKSGEFLFNQFQNMLKQNDVILNKEGYELKFLGKSYARYLSSTKTETFIVPHSQHNEMEKNKDSENIYIIGDNIDALKHLLGSYSGKIKCIYIDPPYNTGSDGFIYTDNFKFTSEQISNIIGIDENEAERILNLSGKSSHSAWLTFMYPRLILARDLLSDDGVIFISIDDNEQANLKLVCDEIFGEENHITSFIWEKKKKPSFLNKNLGTKIEFILCYSKNRENTKAFSFNKTTMGKKYPLNNAGNSLKKLNFPSFSVNFNMSDQIVEPQDMSERNIKTQLLNQLVIKDGKNQNEFSLLGEWRYSQETLNEILKNDEKIIIAKIPFRPNHIKKGGKEKKIHNLLTTNYYPVGTYEDATNEQVNIFLKNYFDYAKPSSLIYFFIKSLTYLDKDSIILDFFSGSATTAHAVMNLNAEDGGNRKYICVQIPEPIKEDNPAFKDGYKTIDEIGRKRIELSAEKIKEETNANIDYGFKLYSLETFQDNIIENLNDFEDNPKLIPEDIIKAFDTDVTEAKNSILSTWLVLDGYGLTVKTEKYKLKNFEADKIENSLYIIQKGLSSEDVIELIRKIETIELDITRIVIYAHSIIFNVLQELRKNLKNLRNNKNVELIERY